MERKDIVKLFLKSKVLLRTDEIEFLEKQSDTAIQEIVSAQSPKDELTKSMTPPKFEILKNLTRKPAPSAEWQNKFFNSRYEQMKNIVGTRIVRDWMSINRLPNRGDAFLTGIVRDIKDGEKTIVELEDPTGSISVSFATKPELMLDEFAAVHANIVGKAVFGKEILYPDVPIRAATKGTGKACFISDLHLDVAPISDARRMFSAIAAEDVDWLFVAGDVGKLDVFEELVRGINTFLIPGNVDNNDPYPQLPLTTKRRNIVALSNPSVVRVGGLTILLCHKFGLDMLRKRHLGPSSEILEDDYLVLDCVPDIVGFGHDHKPLVSNYKAITLVNAGSLLTQATPVVVDFATREWKQLKLQ